MACYIQRLAMSSQSDIKPSKGRAYMPIWDAPYQNLYLIKGLTKQCPFGRGRFSMDEEKVSVSRITSQKLNRTSDCSSEVYPLSFWRQRSWIYFGMLIQWEVLQLPLLIDLSSATVILVISKALTDSLVMRLQWQTTSIFFKIRDTWYWWALVARQIRFVPTGKGDSAKRPEG